MVLQLKHFLWMALLAALPVRAQITAPAVVSALNGTSGTYYAQDYSGADPSVQINACIAAVITAGGGTCDAQAFTGTYTMSQQINVGSSTSYVSHIGVTLLLPSTGTWNWGLTDGVSCGIYQYSSTSIRGSQPGAGGDRMLLGSVNSSTNMDSLYCTDSSPTGGGSYLLAEGFFANNTGLGTFANGVIDIRALYDESHFARIMGLNSVGDAWHVSGICCGVSFDNIQGFSATTSSGGVPFTLGISGTNTHSVSIYDSTFNNPGIGKSNIVVAGGGYTPGIQFYGVYMEGNGGVDTTTAMITNSAQNLDFFGGTANTEIPGGFPAEQASTKYVFATSGQHLNVYGMAVTGTQACVNDTSTSPTINTPCDVGSGNVASLDHYVGGLNSIAHTYYSVDTNLGAANVLGPLLFTSLATPTNRGIATATTGGTLPASTSECYMVVAYNAAGNTLPSPELCVTTGSSTSTNTVSITGNFVPGATGYKFYCRTTGAELLCANLAGSSSTVWTDTGSVTPSGALPSSNTTTPFLSFYNSGTEYWSNNLAGTDWRLEDQQNSAFTTEQFIPGGQTSLNSGYGSSSNVVINGNTNAGTGGLTVQSGGATPTTYGSINSSGISVASVVVVPSSATGYSGTGNLLYSSSPVANGITLSNASGPNLTWSNGTTNYWQDSITNTGTRRLNDVANSFTTASFIPGGQTQINAGYGSTNNINFNGGTNAGTGGVAFYSGGATPTKVGGVDSSGNASFSGYVSPATYKTATNCNSASGTCGSAAAGASALPTGTGSTIVISTTAVTANSEIRLQVDDTLTIPSTTCNSTLATLVGTPLVITARTAGTSFTVSTGASTVISTNPLCFSYTITN